MKEMNAKYSDERKKKKENLEKKGGKNGEATD
jgi:hypothetical protein